MRVIDKVLRKRKILDNMKREAILTLESLESLNAIDLCAWARNVYL